jgi:hypothetical protein
MPVFRVLRPLEPHADEPMATGVPFLVGRDEELGLLRRRWEQAKERLGQVVLLSGTAGIGKSALTEVSSQKFEAASPCPNGLSRQRKVGIIGRGMQPSLSWSQRHDA